MEIGASNDHENICEEYKTCRGRERVSQIKKMVDNKN